MSGLRRASILAFGLVLPAAALAAQAPQPAPQAQAQAAPDESITITGVRDVAREAHDFVAALTPAPNHGQISRMELGMCPVVLGLTAAQKAAVVTRMRRVAQAAGAPVAKARCDANVLIIVTRDKRQLIARLEKDEPDFFPPRWNRDQLRRFAEDPAPAAAWHSEDTVRRDGRELRTDFASGLQWQKTIEPASRLSPHGRPRLLTSIIVVQVDALVGLTATQLADYATMRALTHADPARLGNSGAPTILKVLEAPMGTAIPLTLTAWDLGFLKASYSSRQNVYAGAQRSDMTRDLKQELTANAER
jgi:hypothetical protein